MKKLIILKNLVDFIWIITCIPLIPISIFFSIYMFFNSDILNIINVNNLELETSELSIKIVVLVLIIIALGLIYCFYLFRKILRYFQRRKPFDNYVIDTFNKIGYLLIGFGIASSVLMFISILVFKSKLVIRLGLSPYILLICLGLFFMVLSEIFKIAKEAKQENDLTI